jgi:hypothetical protein
MSRQSRHEREGRKAMSDLQEDSYVWEGFLRRDQAEGASLLQCPGCGHTIRITAEDPRLATWVDGHKPCLQKMGNGEAKPEIAPYTGPRCGECHHWYFNGEMGGKRIGSCIVGPPVPVTTIQSAPVIGGRGDLTGQTQISSMVQWQFPTLPDDSPAPHCFETEAGWRARTGRDKPEPAKEIGIGGV